MKPAFDGNHLSIMSPPLQQPTDATYTTDGKSLPKHAGSTFASHSVKPTEPRPHISSSLSDAAQRGPRLVPSVQRHPRYSPLALWHLLSLDAPSVATLWTIFIAHCSAVVLPWTAPAAMFIAVWIIYAADRLLDARQLDSPVSNLPPTARHADHDLEVRHRFHHRYRSRFFAAILLGAATLLYLLYRINLRSLHLYVLLATLLSVWMLLIHARPIPSGFTRRLPKELAVGIFFPAAVFVPTVARMPSLRPVLLPAAALFAFVCTLNCLYLYAWEHPSPRLHAHWTTRWATRHLTPIAWSALLLAVLTSILAAIGIAAPSGLPAAACSLSAAALILLNALRFRLTPVHLRASADLVLLTPLPLLLFAHLLAR